MFIEYNDISYWRLIHYSLSVFTSTETAFGVD
jgi:hypothetical protein